MGAESILVGIPVGILGAGGCSAAVAPGNGESVLGSVGRPTGFGAPGGTKVGVGGIGAPSFGSVGG